jgi:hypothetical protein
MVTGGLIEHMGLFFFKATNSRHDLPSNASGTQTCTVKLLNRQVVRDMY